MDGDNADLIGVPCLLQEHYLDVEGNVLDDRSFRTFDNTLRGLGG